MNASPPAFPQLAERFAAQRRAFVADPNPPAAVRRERLDRLLKLIDDNEDAFVAAVDADFGGRAAQETRIAELLVTRRALLHARRRLKRWMRTRRVATELPFLPGRNRLTPQPLGVVGIVSPWNYPIQLTLSSAGRGAGGGESRADQALRADAARLGAARRAGGEIFRSRSRQRRRRRRRDRQGFRRAAVRSSAVHRLDRRRPAGGGGGGGQSDADHARTRRQVAGDLRPVLRSRPGERAPRRRQAVQRRPDLHRARLSPGSARPGGRDGGGAGGGDGAPLSQARRQSRLHRDHQRAPSQPPRRPRRRGARRRRADRRGQSGRRELRRQPQAGADDRDRRAADVAADAAKRSSGRCCRSSNTTRSTTRSLSSIAASGRSPSIGSAATRRGASACSERRSPAA